MNERQNNGQTENKKDKIDQQNIDEDHKIEETILKNADFVMKRAEEELGLIAWLLWGTEQFYTEKTYENMLEYINSVSSEELAKTITPIPTVIQTMPDPNGIILDGNFKISVEEKVIQYVYLQNQLNIYPRGALVPRATVEMMSEVLKQKANKPKGWDYRDLKKVSCFWVLPKPTIGRKNAVMFDDDAAPSNLYVKQLGMDEVKEAKDLKAFKDLDHRVYYDYFFFFLGDPNGEDIKDEDKQDVVLRLLDLLFYFDSSLKLSNEDRLNTIKEEYGLDSEILKEVLSSMSDIMTGVQFYAQEYAAQQVALANKAWETKYDTLETEKKALKTKYEDVINFLKKHGIDYKPDDESDGNDEGDEE